MKRGVQPVWLIIENFKTSAHAALKLWSWQDLESFYYAY